jgi:hypothetical protein
MIAVFVLVSSNARVIKYPEMFENSQSGVWTLEDYM